MLQQPQVTRGFVKESLAAVVPLLQPLIDHARAQTTLEKIRAQNPEISREAHLHRIRGNKRWMMLADSIVGLNLPEGFAVTTSEAQHNQGQYALSFPGGIWTIKRQPHGVDDDCVHIQEALEGFLEAVPVPAEINRQPILAYLSVAAKGRARFIAQHPALPEGRVEIALDEFSTPLTKMPQRVKRRPLIRSTRPAQGAQAPDA